VPFGELQRIMVRRLLIEVHLPEAGDRSLDCLFVRTWGDD
jgi:hypothetical protein